MEITALQEQIKVVAEARGHLDRVATIKRASYAQWEQDNNELLAELLLASDVKNQVEAKLREMTLQFYAETGNKKPCEGVAIREVARLDYDLKDALKWAMEHQMALSLDKKAFEGLAKTILIDFVIISTEPQATISTELTEGGKK